MASLYITFPHSGNAWLCPRWMRSYKNGFRSATGEWDTFSDLWQRMASFTERPDLWQCYIRFQLSLAMLHHVLDIWQCHITFPALSGNVT
jgi:hypothetical protein